MFNAEQKPNEGNTTSANRKILENELFDDLKNFLKDCLQQYTKEIIRPKNNVYLRITQSWLNFTKKGQYHHRHAHPNSLVSGCFYVNATAGEDKIYFYKDGYKQLSVLSDDFTMHNSDSWWLPVETGDIILFPSSLTHSVDPVKTNETRISLSFNTFPVGYLGDEERLTGLDL